MINILVLLIIVSCNDLKLGNQSKPSNNNNVPKALALIIGAVEEEYFKCEDDIFKNLRLPNTCGELLKIKNKKIKLLLGDTYVTARIFERVYEHLGPTYDLIIDEGKTQLCQIFSSKENSLHIRFFNEEFQLGKKIIEEKETIKIIEQKDKSIKILKVNRDSLDFEYDSFKFKILKKNLLIDNLKNNISSVETETETVKKYTIIKDLYSIRDYYDLMLINNECQLVQQLSSYEIFNRTLNRLEKFKEIDNSNESFYLQKTTSEKSIRLIDSVSLSVKKDIEKVETFLKNNKCYNWDCYLVQSNLNSKERIQQFIDEFCTEKNETKLFYFSGHGCIKENCEEFMRINENLSMKCPEIDAIKCERLYMILDKCSSNFYGDKIDINQLCEKCKTIENKKNKKNTLISPTDCESRCVNSEKKSKDAEKVLFRIKSGRFMTTGANPRNGSVITNKLFSDSNKDLNIGIIFKPLIGGEDFKNFIGGEDFKNFKNHIQNNDKKIAFNYSDKASKIIQEIAPISKLNITRIH